MLCVLLRPGHAVAAACSVEAQTVEAYVAIRSFFRACNAHHTASIARTQGHTFSRRSRNSRALLRRTAEVRVTILAQIEHLSIHAAPQVQRVAGAKLREYRRKTVVWCHIQCRSMRTGTQQYTYST